MAKIVVMGVAGSGKSVLAQGVAKRLGYPMVEGDDLHLPASQDKMRAGMPLDDADREPWLVRIGTRMSAQEGGIVAACSALKRKYREQLRSHVPDLKFVYLEIDVHTAAQRVRSRFAHLFPTSLVASQFVALESPVGEPGVLRVSALAAPQAQVDAVERWLAAEGAEPFKTGTLG